MLKIRLQRKGKKKHAYFDVVVTEHTTAPKGQYLERIGSYDPHANTFSIKKERLDHWIKNGAQTSSTVHNLLINNKIIEGEKLTSWKPKRKPKEEQKTDAPAKASEKKEQIEEEKKEEPSEQIDTKPKS